MVENTFLITLQNRGSTQVILNLRQRGGARDKWYVHHISYGYRSVSYDLGCREVSIGKRGKRENMFLTSRDAKASNNESKISFGLWWWWCVVVPSFVSSLGAHTGGHYHQNPRYYYMGIFVAGKVTYDILYIYLYLFI